MESRKISICIPTWERNELLFESFMNVYDDERVLEIVIVDDCSSQQLFDNIKEKCSSLKKVHLYRNIENKDCYVNKSIAVSYSKSGFCIILDSDNIIDKSYIDRIFEIKKWNRYIAYMPSFAKPSFSYQNYEGTILTNENISQYIDKKMIDTCLNCMNYFVSRDEYLRVWQKDINPHTADSILQNYNWLNYGNGIFIVPNLSYFHRVHDGSHYMKNVHKTGNFYNEILRKLKLLKMKKNKVCVLGGHGFIGHHIARRLKNEGWWVRTVDIEKYDYGDIDFSDDPIIADLRDPIVVSKVLQSPDEIPFDMVFQFACDMGGAGYIFTGENDANIMHNSALINLNVVYYSSLYKVKKIFYSSSACIYPQQKQQNENNIGLKESDAYPVNPDSEYGYEKIFSERLYDAFKRNYRLDIRVARFHNIFGEYGKYTGGKEKFPAAICRKVAEAKDGGIVEIWGDGKQTRSFLYIDECLEGVMRLMESTHTEPINIGSNERISINDLTKMVIDISGKKLTISNIENRPQGVRGRNSDNTKIESVLHWKPSRPLKEGIEKLYSWINTRVNKE